MCNECRNKGLKISREQEVICNYGEEEGTFGREVKFDLVEER